MCARVGRKRESAERKPQEKDRKRRPQKGNHRKRTAKEDHRRNTWPMRGLHTDPHIVGRPDGNGNKGNKNRNNGHFSRMAGNRFV